MDRIFSDGIDFFSSVGTTNLVHLLWLTLVLELPRYLLAMLSAILFIPKREGDALKTHKLGKISILVAGHNEQDKIETCVKSLNEQSLVPDEIIVVSDGSTDATRARLRDLLHRGLIQGAHGTDLRAGKSAATNLAWRLSSGDILINLDCDTTFDRHAIRNIVRPFNDPQIGAVSGNILVRNTTASLMAALQSIEYLISISLGKRSQAMIDQVSCASGAFSAFRRSALEQVGGLDAAGGGEDLDLTLRMRKAGYGIAFAHDAVSRTDVPATFPAFYRQRMRWERDAIRLRYRTHAEALNPFSRRFSPLELFHEMEFLLFNVLGAMALPVYLVWLFWTYGDVAPAILGAAFLAIMVIDLVTLSVASLAMPGHVSLGLLTLVPAFSLFNGLVMRIVRVIAYVEEWVFTMSTRDEYVPRKVRDARSRS